MWGANIQKRLLAEADLTLEKAVQLSQARDLKELQLPQALESVHKVKANVRVTCFRCGKRGHLATSCKFKAESCYKCGKIGHTKVPKPNKEVKLLQEEEIETEDDYTLFQMGMEVARNQL